MISRDNKSRDCEVNEVTAYKGRVEGSRQSSRSRSSSWNWRPTDIQLELSKVKSPWHKLRYRNPIFPNPAFSPPPFLASLLHHPVPRAPSAILPDAIFPRRIISYSIANYIECYQAADFSPRFDLSGMSRQGLANKFQDDRTICSFVLIEFSLPSFFFFHSPMSLFARIYKATLYFSLLSMKQASYIVL